MTKDVEFGSKDVPLVLGFMRGYRAWRVGYDPFELRAVAFTRFRWTPGVMRAICQSRLELEQQLQSAERGKHPCSCGACVFTEDELQALRVRLMGYANHYPPSTDSASGCCGACGFYAANSMDHLSNSLENYIASGRDIVGSIKATGRVVAGTKGFRAERAQVEALVGTSEQALKLGDMYDVPVFPTPAALAVRFPPTPVEGITTVLADPEELIGEPYGGGRTWIVKSSGALPASKGLWAGWGGSIYAYPPQPIPED